MQKNRLYAYFQYGSHAHAVLIQKTGFNLRAPNTLEKNQHPIQMLFLYSTKNVRQSFGSRFSKMADDTSTFSVPHIEL